MYISKEILAQLSRLSKLELSEQEQQKLTDELQTVINYMQKLSLLPEEDTNPADHAVTPCNVFREDRVICSQNRSELLLCAPATNGETFTVPKTVD